MADRPERPKGSPVLRMILGRASEKVGKERGELWMVRRGRQMQQEAREALQAQKSSSDPNSPPTSTPPRKPG